MSEISFSFRIRGGIACSNGHSAMGGDLCVTTRTLLWPLFTGRDAVPSATHVTFCDVLAGRYSRLAIPEPVQPSTKILTSVFPIS